MAWGSSAIFRQFIADIMENTLAIDIGSGGDTMKVALYNNSITPDNDVDATNSTYNNGQWTSASNEVFDAGQWDVAGVALTSQAVDISAADIVEYTAANTASGSAFTTPQDTYGCLVYSVTASGRGVCYNYFGGPASVTNGTLTVQWNANGIFRITL